MFAVTTTGDDRYMNPVAHTEADLRAKVNGIFLDLSFFPYLDLRYFHYVLSPNIILGSHSGVRRIDTSIRSKNNSTLTTEKRRILVVDDDPDIASLFKLSLEREGFVVHSFNDPLLALSNYKAGAYDLLLFDIKMPHMNGFELYQKIRLADNHAKVCFISAFEEYHTEFNKSFPNLKEEDCFIRKPIGLEPLTKKVKSLLHDK
jgi:two-component system response regulator ChvI